MSTNKKRKPVMTSSSFLSFFVLCLPDIIYNPGTNFFGSIFRSAFYLNFRSAYIGIQRSVYCTTDKCTFFLTIEIFKQHGYGKNLCQRIGYVQSLCLWP